MSSLMNLEKAKDRMKENSLDVLVASSIYNVYYMTGFFSHGKYVTSETVIFSLLSRNRNYACIVAPSFDKRILYERPSWVKNAKFYGMFYIEGFKPIGKEVKDPIAGFIEAIEELKIDDVNIGIEETLPMSVYEQLRKHLPKSRFTNASNIFRELRSIKSDEERRRMRKAAEITEMGIRAAINVAREGTTELELANAFKAAVVEKGGDVVFDQVGVDPASAGRYPTSVKLKRGDLVRIDAAASYEGYVDDLARTFVIGRASEKQVRVYNALLEAQQKGIDMVKRGEKPSKIYKAVVESVRKRGYSTYDRHHVGHGLGLEVYEAPMLIPTNNTSLKENMILNVETPYYIVGVGGFNVEDTLLVTKDGCDCFTTLDRELLEL